jgi:hypothetical protein
MRSSIVVLGGLGLMLAACNAPGSGPAPQMPAGTPSASSSTIAPVQGQDDMGPGRAGAGVMGSPTAGTGTISPIQGGDSQPPRPGMGRSTAGSSTTSPVQGQDDMGTGRR